MPLASPSFRAIGTTNCVVATEPAQLDPALTIMHRELVLLDAAASRFRADSELSRLHARAATRDVVARVSRELAWVLGEVLDAARRTDGLVDPTIGASLIAAGYDTDLDTVQARRNASGGRLQAAGGWQRIRLDRRTRFLTLPRGMVIDIGAIGKAACADRIAACLAESLPGGFLVDLGGDLACGGPAPAGGWLIGVENDAGALVQTVASDGQALATSSTAQRTWSADGEQRHHIIDPGTGQPAAPVWRQVTCVGATCVEANSASTAAIVLGTAAPAWLEQREVSARLEQHDGSVVRTGSWPVGVNSQGVAA